MQRLFCTCAPVHDYTGREVARVGVFGHGPDDRPILNEHHKGAWDLARRISMRLGLSCPPQRARKHGCYQCFLAPLRELLSMAYIITEPCIGTKDSACVDVCPVDCIHPRKDEARLRVGRHSCIIHPDECIDCGACVPACPVEAIFALDEVPDKWKNYIEINAKHYQK